MNSATVLLLDTVADAVTAAAGLETTEAGAETNIPDEPRDGDSARGLLDEVSLPAIGLLVCVGDGIIESSKLVSSNDVCSETVS